LNTKEFQEIQRLSSDRPTRAAEKLLNILLTQTEDFYNCFLDVLRETNQLHVRQWIVLEGLFILVVCFALYSQYNHSNDIYVYYYFFTTTFLWW